MNAHKKITALIIYLLLIIFASTNAYCQEPVKELFSANYGKPEINYEKVILATLFMVVAVFVVLTLLKKVRFKNTSKQRLVEVVFNYPITSKDKLLIVKVASEYLLLGSSNSGIRKLHKLDTENIESAVTQSNLKKYEFANIFANTLGRSRNA